MPSARILVVEDHPANLELMAYLLGAYGYSILRATDGDEGMQIAAQERPDLIVCDVQLPEVDGYAVAGWLKRQASLAEIPVVAVTAAAMVGDRDRAIEAGFDGYIPKPIVPETFVAQVEAFLPCERWSRMVSPVAPASEPRPAPEPRHRILVVDDEPVNLSLQLSLLEPNGYKVLTATGKDEALARARDASPHLILSDVNMVDGSGFELIEQVKADPRLRAISFIFITSTYCNDIYRRQGLALGADRFLFRPIEPMSLLAEIEACLKEVSKE